MMIPGLFVYAMFAVWFIWMGIGSIKARRWARALTLASSWLWLIFGVIATVVISLSIPQAVTKMYDGEEIAPIFILITKIIIGVIVLVFYILIPGMFISVYRRRNIKMTCELYDRQIRWTDQCPLPVLALVLLFGFAALYLLGMLSYARVAPFFGFLLGGVRGIIILLIMAAVSGYLAWGLFRLDIRSWWVTFLFVILVSISTALTFYKVGFKGVYFAMLFPEQLKFVKQFMYPKSAFEAFYGIWGIPIVGYLWFVRKYFVGQKKRDYSRVL
jgi:hypothetical protein